MIPRKPSFDLSNVFTVFLQMALVIFLILIAVLVFRGLRQQGNTIQAFQVPKHLVEQGLNGQVFGMRVKDQIEVIKTQVNSIKDDSTNQNTMAKPDLNLEVLGIGFSTNSLLLHISDLFGIENRTITGDLTDIDHELRLSIRHGNASAETIIQPYEAGDLILALDSLVLKASLKILEKTDPYRLAVWYYKSDQIDKSLKVIRQMISSKHEDMAWAYLAWGNIRRKEQKSEQAIGHFQKALELKPNLVLASRNIGWIYYQQKEYAKARDHFEMARKKSSDPNFGVNNGLALCYVRLGNVEKAEEAFKRNIHDYPSFLWSYGNYSNFVMNSLGDTLRAAQIFKEASGEVEENSDYFVAQSGYYLISQNYDSAHLMIQKALEQDPGNINALMLGAQLTIEGPSKSHELAEKYLRRSIREIIAKKFDTGMLQSSYNLLAMNDYHQNKLDSALVHVKQAIAIYPAAGYPYSTLAETYVLMGKKELFYQALQQAVDRGFHLDRYIDEEPYNQFKDEERFKALLEKKFMN